MTITSHLLQCLQCLSQHSTSQYYKYQLIRISRLWTFCFILSFSPVHTSLSPATESSSCCRIPKHRAVKSWDISCVDLDLSQTHCYLHLDISVLGTGLTKYSFGLIWEFDKIMLSFFSACTKFDKKQFLVLLSWIIGSMYKWSQPNWITFRGMASKKGFEGFQSQSFLRLTFFWTWSWLD